MSKPGSPAPEGSGTQGNPEGTVGGTRARSVLDLDGYISGLTYPEGATCFPSCPLPPLMRIHGRLLDAKVVRRVLRAFQSGFNNMLQAADGGQISVEESEEYHEAGDTAHETRLFSWYYNEGFRTGAVIFSARKSHPSAGAPKAPKINHPEEFRGDKDKLEHFVSQLRLCIASDPRTFATEGPKISYAASYLRGPVYDWFTANSDPETGETRWKTLDDLLLALRSAWGDPDARATAERKIRDLRQGKDNASTYYSKFATLRARVNWNDDALKDQFRRGLRDEIKDMLIHRDPPANFEAFVKLCISLDNAWHIRQAEKAGRQNQSSGPQKIVMPQKDPGLPSSVVMQQQSTASGTHPGPMDLSALVDGHISEKERSRRRRNNLCMYCAGSGHFASTCPAKLQRAQDKNKKFKKFQGGKQGQQGARANAASSESAPGKSGPASANSAVVLYETTSPSSKN